MLDHRVQDKEQFAQAGGERDFGGLSYLYETPVKSLDHRVVPGCYQGGRVEGGPPTSRGGHPTLCVCLAECQCPG